MTTTRGRAAGSITVLIPATEPVVADLLAVRTSARPPIDIVDQWGMQSFPASDPPSNW
jgi:hypothetical protein